MAKRSISLLLAFLMLVTNFGSMVFAIENGQDTVNFVKSERLNAQAKASPEDDDDVRIMVELTDAPALEARDSVKAAASYQKKLTSAQDKAIKKVEKALKTELSDLEQFSLLFNGFSFSGKAGDIDVINGFEGMRAYVSPTFDLIEPEMSTSTETVGAVSAWDLDYTGKGMTIAIIDTGIRETHEAFSVDPEGAKYDIPTLQAKLDEVAEYLHAEPDAQQLYMSAKIPVGYDYEYSDCTPEHGSSDHGTHVAGIAAGNNGSGFRGIAYDAQLFVMQVFGSNGSAEWDTMLRALEDCAYLGVDAVNMSLGAACGSCSYADESYEAVFTRLDKAGVLVAAASGNDASQADYNRWGGYQLAQNPDSGLTSSPGTLYPSLSVASTDNKSVSKGIITAYGTEITYEEPASGAPSILTVAGEYEYVYCGLGAEDEMPADLTGKVALMQRGDLTFTEKAQNAKAHGAVAVMVYNNISGSFSNIFVESEIPFVTLQNTDGEFLVSQTTDGIGTLVISDVADVAGLDNISSFSSRGTTADLKIKPEISAPGGGIYSSIGFGTDTSYASWNGTSMATPHVAGGMVIVKEYAKQKFPDATAEELSVIVDSMLMGSAQALKNELVTAQGAGLMDLENAVQTGTYLTVNGDRPKLELDESEDYTWEYEFEVTNFSDSAVTYSISHKYMMQDTTDKVYDGTTLTFTTDTPRDVTSLVAVDGAKSVTVQAGETVTVKFAIDAKGVMEVYGEKFPVGAMLEGFVFLTNDTEELSIPLLGFMGDWDKQSIFDRGFYWQEITGELNLNSNGRIAYNYAVTQRNKRESGVGYNPYVGMQDTFNPDWGAISPDFDGNCDSVAFLRFGVLRNCKTLTIEIETPRDTVTVYEADLYDFAKDFFSSSGYTYSNYALNYIGEGLYEGETAYITITATLDHEGFTIENNECAQWTIPVTLDTTAPTVYMDGGKVTVYDEHYMSFTALYNDENLSDTLVSPTPYFDMTRGQTHVIDTEGEYYLYVGDYAGNTAVYKVNTAEGTIERTDEPTMHTVVFKVDDTVYHAERLYEGDTVKLPEDPTKEYHVFEGWDVEIPETMPDHDIVTNAVFTKNTYKVTFLDMDGTVISEQTVEHGEAAEAPTPPEHEGYIFVAWDNDFSCVTEDMEITAIYEKEVLIGDVNFDGRINTADAVVVLKYAADMIELDSTGFTAADVNFDETVNTQDAVIILQHAAGMIAEF